MDFRIKKPLTTHKMGKDKMVKTLKLIMKNNIKNFKGNLIRGMKLLIRKT